MKVQKEISSLNVFASGDRAACHPQTSTADSREVAEVEQGEGGGQRGRQLLSLGNKKKKRNGDGKKN